MSWLITKILSWLSGGVLDRVLGHLERRAASDVERERIRAETAQVFVHAEIESRRAARDIVIAEQGWWVTALIRPAFAYPLAVYYAAIIADSLFHFDWNVAALPAPDRRMVGLDHHRLFSRSRHGKDGEDHEAMSEPDRHWHLDKRVPIAIIFAIMTQTAGITWWAARLDSRVAMLEAEVASRDKFRDRITIVETKMIELTNGQRRIEGKLDRLISSK